MKIGSKYTGLKINSWTILEVLPTERGKSQMAMVQCECGAEHKRPLNNIVKEKSKSCRECYNKRLNWSISGHLNTDVFTTETKES